MIRPTLTSWWSRPSRSGRASPALSRPAKDIGLTGDAEAAVLAVIRDETPELVEDETTRLCQPGDRVVIAARRQHVAAVARHLAR